MKTIFVKPTDTERKWYVIDAADQRLGRVAVEAARLLRGKHKPEFAPHQEIGDYVVIVNADKVTVTGRKATQKMYYRHSGYLGSLRSESFQKMLKRRPEYPLEHAVRGMLPKNRLGRKLFTNLKVYAGAEHPHTAQQPEVYTIPPVKES
ncbi:50S ribosomal protein L13 [Alkalispirochaeta sphaeroplastigenens]|uniref:Large ribosomal subunit protein uL13 n=1 Tax=Alkalispirochaeta sphaeroplastigenens TaxID=1187066 RepID=A0A2S4JNF1_9SPIO|nr:MULTISPECIES: 50S ribosomal protein L13 [Alkalispirochaeta]POR01041.1 50S ribosomal protein L13 [Alkalispirochaeta sphaeroplastigenens]